MSVTSRLISGSAASWARIAVTMIAQVALVPLYLSHWNVSTYGIWIAIQALVNLLSTLDRGYVEYLGYEFLRMDKENRSKVSLRLWSGLTLILIIGLVEFALILSFSGLGYLPYLLGEKEVVSLTMSKQIAITFMLQWVGWTYFSNTTGLFFRALTPYGYYPRMGWWNVISAIITAAVPAVAVVMGANLLVAGIWAFASLFVVSLMQFFDIFNLLKKTGIPFVKSSFKIAFKDYSVSLVLSGRFFLENFRQQGVRLLLAPFTGSAGIAAFSTMRTAANVAQQGLLTITHPLLPELMRFLSQRDKERTQAAFDTVWLVVVFVLAPAVVILQAMAPPLFHLWTGGQIIYDPLLFGTLSLGVLVYAWAQPALAIMVGNNLLKNQIVVSIVSAVIVVGLIVITIGRLGILGAGIALLVAELVAAFYFQWHAKVWLAGIGLTWPRRSSTIAGMSVLISAAGMIAMIYIENWPLMVLALTLLVLVLNMRQYYLNMPAIAKEKLRSMVLKLPLVGRKTIDKR